MDLNKCKRNAVKKLKSVNKKLRSSKNLDTYHFYIIFSEAMDTVEGYEDDLDNLNDTNDLNQFKREISNQFSVMSEDEVADYLFDKYKLNYDLPARYYSIPPKVFLDLYKVSYPSEYTYFKIDKDLNCTKLSVNEAIEYIKLVILALK